MRNFRKLTPLFLVLLMNILGFGILFFSSASVDTQALYYSLALLGLVLVSYMLIVFFSMGDHYLFLIVSALLTVGILMLFRLDPTQAMTQITWFYVGMAGFYAVYILFRKCKAWPKLFPFYALIAFFLFVFTLLFGSRVNGAKNWLSLGGISLQPSEPIKILFILGLAALYTAPYGRPHDRLFAFTEKRLPRLMRPLKFLMRLYDSQTGRQLLIMVYAFLHLGFLVLQREWGSAVLYFLIYFVLQFVLSSKYYFLLINAVLAMGGGLLGYKFMSHIQERVAIWRDPFSGTNDLGYQIAQSLYAMSAGGFSGTGIGQGQPWRVPVVKSDFIFSAIYEELGMLGASAVVLLFFLLVYRGIKISLMVKTPFYKAVALGIAVMFGFQTLIIIGGVTKLIPLTGITLPFMSAGGSSLATSFASLAILQAISAREEDMSDDI
ncbi:MAG: FtsW/RodA/SpoVE family cell cycle protein [Clostridia bacterium]|nr:FtsW/RodA/SpoVE family cell cycle protein [Clostridia bacterium]